MELTNIGVIKDLFERHGFSFTKSLGQNFLVNPAVCPKIAELGGAKAGVCALEIGTGVGVLTKELAERCEKVIAVEIDTSLKPILEETLADYDNVEIVFADVMETDLAALLAQIPACKAVVCTGAKAAETAAETMGCRAPKQGEMEKINFAERDLKFYRMPSSSRAYPMKLEKKAEIYSAMFGELGFPVLK